MTTPPAAPPEPAATWHVTYLAGQVELHAQQVEWMVPPIMRAAEYAEEQLLLLAAGAQIGWPTDVRIPPGVIRCEVHDTPDRRGRRLGVAERVFAPAEP